MQMKAMKTCFLLMGMLFGWTAAPLFGQDYDRQTKEILEQLDRTIRHKSDYHRLKEARIDSLKQSADGSHPTGAMRPLWLTVL